MKKLFIITKITVLILIGATIAQAKVSPEALTAQVERQAAKHSSVYLNNRVKTMCQEWPGCEKWALARQKANPSFTIIDAEVEYYVEQNSGWPFWQHNFYVKVLENLQEQFYVFRTEINHKSENPYSFPGTPQRIAKFPGHPFTDMPSEHAKYELENRYGAPYHSKKMRRRWPEISVKHWGQMGRGVEQQRVIWNKNDNPRWERRFDYTILSGIYPVEDMKRYAVIARQNKLGQPFQYIDAPKTSSILIRAEYIPDYCITINYRPKEISNK